LSIFVICTRSVNGVQRSSALASHTGKHVDYCGNILQFGISLHRKAATGPLDG
jgi:hypothetical protein